MQKLIEARAQAHPSLLSLPPDQHLCFPTWLCVAWVPPVPKACEYNNLFSWASPVSPLGAEPDWVSHRRTQDSAFGDFGGRWLERKTGAVSLKVFMSSPSVWRVSQAVSQSAFKWILSTPANEYIDGARESLPQSDALGLGRWCSCPSVAWLHVSKRIYHPREARQ